MWSIFVLVLVSLGMHGCGPSLQRPGYRSPRDRPPVSDIVVFENAQNEALDQMRFYFAYKSFSALNGVKAEILKVISKYPPGTVRATGRVLALQVDKLIDERYRAKIEQFGMLPRDMECVRDFSRLCPSRWTDLGDGQTCLSPPSLYVNEECRQVVFGGLNPLEKSLKAQSCDDSKYPCIGECLQDWSKLCPDGWSPKGPKSTVCVAPPSYIQPCINSYDFYDHNARQKRKFADLCKVNWPCKTTR